MIRFAIALFAALVAIPAFAQEPVGCDKFKWPLDRERALLTAPDAAMIANGAEVAPPLAKAIRISLAVPADAKLPMTPGRPPRSADGKAGFVRVAALPREGAYRITLSSGGWIDVIQDNRSIKSGAFSGATGCEGVRKSVTFDLAAAPLIVQFSSVPTGVIGMVMTPVAP
jgi:hypothetical protein